MSKKKKKKKTKLYEDRLGDFTRDRRVLILVVMALAVGAISAFAAYGLVWLIAVITNFSFYQHFSTELVSPTEHRLGVAVVVVPMIGGLIVGLMARYGSEKIRGHGIPEALEAILIGRSRMDAKVAFLKPLSSAISIGTGGPFGAEGPIIMTGGAFGSLFAQFFNLSTVERKTLLVAGAAGGMSAIFSAPVAAVLLAVELLLFEWKPRSFIPVAVSSAVAGTLRIPLLGAGPIFPVPPHAAPGVEELIIALLVGITAGFGSWLVTALVYGSEDFFKRLPIHWMWWPVIGCLFVGVGGFINPRVLGVGYDTIHDLLQGEVVGLPLVSLLVIKALVWSIALGAGTSGGVLAPLLIMGGALGATEAVIFPLGDAGLWATIGMAAVMGGTMGAPFTAMVFTLELTHDLNVFPALMVGCVASYAVAVLVMRRSILTEKVARHGYHIAREYSVDLFDTMRVGEVMDSNAPTIPDTMKLSELSNRIAQGDPKLSTRQGTPIVDAEGRLVGMITRGDLVKAIGQNGDRSVLEAGSRNLIVAYPDEILREAVTRMLKNNIGRLPVVSRADPLRLVGYLGRSSILEARLRLEEEQTREPGWLTHPPS
jgi:CIC family chloride channel protein